MVERDELGLSGWALSELVEASHPYRSTGSRHPSLSCASANGPRSVATDLALGIESRACALVTEGEAAEVHYRESIEYLGLIYVPIQLAQISSCLWGMVTARGSTG